MINLAQKNRLMVLRELMVNAKRSDRDISKLIGISQPTVTRARTTLVKEGFIQGFTAIPDLSKLGFKLVAYTLMKFTDSLSRYLKEDDRVIYAVRVNWKLFVVSVHKDYADFAIFSQQTPIPDFQLLQSTTEDTTIKPLQLDQLIGYEC